MAAYREEAKWKFETDILAVTNNKSMANYLECLFITEYGSALSDKGYNGGWTTGRLPMMEQGWTKYRSETSYQRRL